MREIVVWWLLVILSSGAYAQVGEEYCKDGKVVCLSKCSPVWKQKDGFVNRRPQYEDHAISRIESLKPLDDIGIESFWIECRVRICSGKDAADAVTTGDALCLPKSEVM